MDKKTLVAIGTLPIAAVLTLKIQGDDQMIIPHNYNPGRYEMLGHAIDSTASETYGSSVFQTYGGPRLSNLPNQESTDDPLF
ncbi:MAG: hypothetical protein AB7F86_09670 [Bdellovibrionales bacterium]